MSHALLDAGRVENLIDPSVARDLLKQHVRVNDHGQLEVVNPDTDTPRLNAAFTPMTVSELLKSFAAERPYLVRGGTKPGTGSSESQRMDVSANGKYSVEQIFGPKSNGAFANKLKKENPAGYATLKAIARERGLV